MSLSESLKVVDPDIFNLIQEETVRQEYGLEMIPSENFVSEAVLEACGSILTNKYAEGLPHKRYYGGCEVVDKVEELAIARAKQLFSAEFVNVQPHSGAQANQSVFEAFLKPGDVVMGMRLDQGGHLTHGSPVNFSGKNFTVVSYGVKEEDGLIDYQEMEALIEQHKPKLVIAGASAYSRVIDFERIAKAAKSVSAICLADIAHYAGLVVAGVYPSPVEFCDLVSTTTHKTLRGPRSGMIMGKQQFASAINKAIFPGLQGGPHMHTIAAKAVAFKEALAPGFKQYAQQVVSNAKALAAALTREGLQIVTGGTDSHMMLVDLRPVNITGKEAQVVLDSIGVTCNKNSIPFDPQPFTICSGVRLGTPALTTRGMGTSEMQHVAQFISQALRHARDTQKLATLREEVRSLSEQFPLYRDRLV